MSILDRYMNKAELAIADISGAELIKYYYMPDGVMGLLVIKDSRVFNLSSGEKYFESLEQAALRAYASCSEAAADDLTRKILTERSGEALSPIFGKYEGIVGAFERTLPFEKDKVSTFRKMIEYYLEMIYEKLGFGTSFPGELRGYRRRYSLSFRLNNERKTIPFSYSERGNCFDMVFGNFIEASDSVKLSVRYTFGKISVTADVRCKNHIRTENTFDMLRKTETLRIFDETEIVYDSSKAIASISGDIPEEIRMICIGNKPETLQLPWGRAFFNDSDNRSEMILYQKNSFDNIAFLYQSEREYLSDDKSIVTDSMTALHEIFYTGREINICTHFLPTGSFSRGVYKQKYENRYFYRSFEDIGGKENGSKKKQI
ncbi:MAG: hypothetical protein ACI4KF_08920 [Huintestinicola sp.]